jgi:DNA-directed RNA polymerase specialized sigma24 family protein
MIESYFDESPPVADDEPNNSKSARDQHVKPDSDDSWLDALGEVKKIVRRKSFSYWHTEAADLVQGIALRLFKWRSNNKDKSQDMSPEEWQKFAARTALNEINRRLSDRNSALKVSFDETSDFAADNSPEGQSITELSSLALVAWQEICKLTLRQRRALLLHSQKLYVYLLASGISNDEIAAALEISIEDWLETQKRIPLSDSQIADLIIGTGSGKKFGSSSKSVKKARTEARGKLRRVTDK